MGFFQLDEVIDAFRNGKLEDYCDSMSQNDLVLLKHEITGFAAKHGHELEMDVLLERLDEMMAAK
ncbi:MAG: hypothetical protein IT350_05270 [Deltaproteobacteria bacterium]|nr:hypothetical protein [Deltaproteobacteria bacterium]